MSCHVDATTGTKGSNLGKPIVTKQRDPTLLTFAQQLTWITSVQDLHKTQQLTFFTAMQQRNEMLLYSKEHNFTTSLCILLHIYVVFFLRVYRVRLCSEMRSLTGPLSISRMIIWVWRVTAELYWQGKIDELGDKSVPVSLCPQQIQNGLYRARPRAFAVIGRPEPRHGQRRKIKWTAEPPICIMSRIEISVDSNISSSREYNKKFWKELVRLRSLLYFTML